MSSKTCPKTCTHLTTAAIFISIGIMQFLAGIILLKSEYVYLLAGIDFIAAIANIIVGSCLGISSSVWENKKHLTSKSVRRKNFLAGLYMSIMVMNATSAIVLILGEGNKLLIIQDDQNLSAVFFVEILACAYVFSVCSPIICTVIALVCLSGNRMQLKQNTKKRDSLSKTKSYGWVFQYGGRSKKLSDQIYSPQRSISISDDDVFSDRKPYSGKALMNKRFFKHSFNETSISLREIQSPLERWAQERRKMLEEVTTPKRFFFSDDYLNFPEFSYSSYAGTIIPRVRQTSLVYFQNQNDTTTSKPLQSTNNYENKMDEAKPSKQCEMSSSKVSSKSIANCSSQRNLSCQEINGETEFNKTNNYHEKINKLSNETLKSSSVDELDSTKSNPNESQFYDHNKRPGETLTKQIDGYQTTYSSQNIPVKFENVLNYATLEKNIEDPGVESKIDTELKSPFQKDVDKVSNVCQNVEFLKSFKGNGKQPEDSNFKNKYSTEISPQNDLSDNSANVNDELKTLLAGEIIPIKISTKKVSESENIPISDISSINNRLLDDSNYNQSLATSNLDFKDGKFSRKSKSLYIRNCNDKKIKHFVLDNFKVSSIKQFEKKQDIAQRILSMGSIDESPAEDEHFNTDPNKQALKNQSADSSLNRNSRIQFPEKNVDSQSSKQNDVISTSSSNLLRKLWSLNTSQDKEGLSSLIMDKDSLIGLSEEELKARTNRIRQLRKSVQLRARSDN